MRRRAARGLVPSFWLRRVPGPRPEVVTVALRGTCGDAYRDVKELLTERGVQVDQAYVRTVSLGASICMSIGGRNR